MSVTSTQKWALNTRMHGYHYDHKHSWSVAAVHKTVASESDVRTLAHQFAEKTTIHGAWYILGPRQHILSRCVWLVTFLGSVIVCGTVLVPQFRSFINGDTTTIETVEVQEEAIFPAVTICNTNQYRRSVIGHSAQFREFATGLDSLSAAKYCSYDDANSLTENVSTDVPTLASQLGVSGFMLFAPDSYQSLVECKIMKHEKNCGDLFVNHRTDRDFCFTFNAGKGIIFDEVYDNNTHYYPDNKQRQLFRVYNSGERTGIELVLNAHVDDYCWSDGHGAGFIVMVHHPDVKPSTKERYGVRLAPGTHNTIFIATKKIVRKTENLMRCTSAMELKYFSKTSQYFTENCLHDCSTKFLWDRCECFEVSAPAGAFIQRHVAGQPFEYCVTQKQRQCMKEAIWNFSAVPVNRHCTCLPPCQETQYIPSVSTLDFPTHNEFWHYMDKKYPNLSDAFAYISSSDIGKGYPNFKSLYADTNKQFGNFTSTKDVQENLAKVSIFLTSMSVNVLVEQRTVSGYELVSQIGGATGLFLGASIMSSFEILYWLWCAVGRCMSNYLKPKNVSRDTPA